MRELMRLSDISRHFNVGYYKARKIFNACKSIDNDPYGLRPTQVPIDLCYKVMGLSTRSLKKYLESNENA